MRRTMLALLALLCAAPVAAQDLSDVQLRQRIGWAIARAENADDIRIRVGELIRASSGLGRTRSLAVVVTDGSATTIGSDTFTGSDITNVQDGAEHIIAIDPGVEGPQTITVTATVSIDP